MKLFPEIHEQLENGAFSADDSEPDLVVNRRRALLRTAVSRVPAVLAVAFAVAVAAVFLVARHRHVVPRRQAGAAPTPAEQTRWLSVIETASLSVAQHDTACRVGPTPGVSGLPGGARGSVRPPKFLTTAPPRSITSILSSLGSRPAASHQVSREVLGELHLGDRGIYARYAFEGHAGAVRYYVIPASLIGATSTVPSRCYHEDFLAFKQEAQHLPASQRTAAIAFAAQQLTPASTAGITIITLGDNTNGTENLRLLQLNQLRTKPTTGLMSGGTTGPKDFSITTPVVVSNDVASVTATYPAQSHPGRVSKTFSVTKQPERNVVVFHLHGAFDAPAITLRSKTGKVIARMHH